MKLKIIGISFLVLLSCGCSKKEKTINDFDSDLVCRSEFREIIEDEEIKSTSKIFLNIDDDLVSKAIYQSISAYNSSSELNMYEEIAKLYNSMEGINALYYVVDNSIVLEITYDYEVIDLDQIKLQFGNMLDQEGLFMSVDKIPVSLDTFKNIELANYECEEK